MRTAVWDQNTFEERQVPPMSAEMFSALVTSRLRPIQGIEVQGGKGLQLDLRVHGQDVIAPLERYYDRYRADPTLLSPVINQFIETLVAGAGESVEGTEEFARVALKLRPRLITAQQWMDKRNAGLRLVVRPIAQDIGVALVLDQGNELEYVQLEQIPVWGIDAQGGFEVATANLARISSSIQTTERGEGVEKILLDHNADGLAAERALLPVRLKAWQAQVQGELVLGMPTHEFLLGLSRDHPALDEIRAQVSQDAQVEADGLSPNLLIVREGALEILE